MCQSYTTQRVQRPNLKAVIIQAFSKPVSTGATDISPATPAAVGTPATGPSTPQSVPRSPATPQKPRTQGGSVVAESSVIPAWKLFAADW